MFNFFRQWRERRIIARSRITEAQWQTAFARLPLLHGLDDDERRRLRELVILFLHRKVFEGAKGLEVDLPMALTIALQACLPILRLGLDWYDGFTAIIVYPAGFAPERVVRDEAGVEHRVQTGLAGEAWQRGPVILAWDDTAHAGVVDGYNLVIHEFAHKLDMRNGEANGFPPLHVDMDARRWTRSFSEAYEDLKTHCAQGGHPEIDCYAATSPAEFFAVLSEIFFEKPQVIRRHYPAVLEQLSQFYRQDPQARLE